MYNVYTLTYCLYPHTYVLEEFFPTLSYILLLEFKVIFSLRFEGAAAHRTPPYFSFFCVALMEGEWKAFTGSTYPLVLVPVSPWLQV